MKDNDTTYSMETIYKSGITQFISYYNQIKFVGTVTEYHKQNGQISKMIFEQIN